MSTPTEITICTAALEDADHIDRRPCMNPGNEVRAGQLVCRDHAAQYDRWLKAKDAAGARQMATEWWGWPEEDRLADVAAELAEVRAEFESRTEDLVRERDALIRSERAAGAGSLRDLAVRAGLSKSAIALITEGVKAGAA